MFDKMTSRVRTIFFLAREEAVRLHDRSMSTEHLLLGLLREGDGLAVTVLLGLGLDPDSIRQAIEKAIVDSGRLPVDVDLEAITVARDVERVLKLCVDEALLLDHNYIGTEHLLLGLIGEGDGIAARVLAGMGVDRDRARKETLMLLEESSIGQVGASGPLPGASTPELLDLARRIEALATRTEEAIRAMDYDRAATYREEERALRREYHLVRKR